MKTIALVFHGDSNPPRNLFDNENFKELADTIMEVGFSILPVQYHYSVAKQVEAELEKVAAVMSWVEPVDRMVKGKDNLNFDELLTSITQKGVLVSTHPEVIFKLGTKKVLYSTRDMDWGGDTELYANPVDFEKRFLRSLAGSRPRILKQYRGSSGRGVFKVWLENGLVRVIHASGGDQWSYAEEEFHREFARYFENDGLLINQQWIEGIVNGMVRAYLTGTKVSGFGYQDSVALGPRPASRRYYFSEECGLFQDLRRILEAKWVPQLQEIHSISDDMMPLLWDIDLFINDVNTTYTEQKYTLCEINVSGVSPFPPSCSGYIARALSAKLC